MGGPSAALQTMQQNNKEPYCTCCCPTEPVAFYNKVLNSLWWMIWIRVPLIIIATVGSYIHLQALYAIGTFLSLYLIGHAVACLLSFYENNYYLKMGHAYKMLTVKLSVGIIVVEAVVETLLYMTGTFNNITPASGYSTEGTVVRIFCFIVLLEYIVLSLAMWMIWSAPVEYTGFASDKGNAGENTPENARPSASAGLSLSAGDTNDVKPSFGAFVSDVFALTDLWYKYPLDLDSSGAGLNAPLISAGSAHSL